MDSAYLLETLAGNFMDVVQYNEDNRGFEVRKKVKDHKMLICVENSNKLQMANRNQTMWSSSEVGAGSTVVLIILNTKNKEIGRLFLCCENSP